MDLDHPQRLWDCGERSRAAHPGFFPKKLEEFLDRGMNANPVMRSPLQTRLLEQPGATR
jgi:hypothetical protein